ncbi:MAG: polysaccharide deacetylase family protein [Flavobacterium psychrophilum]
MNKFILFFLFISFTTLAQINPDVAKSAVKIELLFPNAKNKALILSYDDGRTEDRQLVQLFNKYKLPGTFHLNSNKLGSPNYLTKNEIKTLFQGHEVSVHSANHPNLVDLNRLDVIQEVMHDRKELERLMGYPVRGMAYPFGNTNNAVIDVIHELGIDYARTVGDTYNFEIPTNYLSWFPTMHQFAKAYWEPNQPEKDKQELAKFYAVIEEFLHTNKLAVMDIWGHSWEMGNDPNKWAETEKFLQLLANNIAIHYSTHLDLVDYLHAFKNLKFSVDKMSVTNPSAIPVWFTVDQKVYEVKGGETKSLVKN